MIFHAVKDMMSTSQEHHISYMSAKEVKIATSSMKKVSTNRQMETSSSELIFEVPVLQQAEKDAGLFHRDINSQVASNRKD